MRDHARRLERQHPRQRLDAARHRVALLRQRLATAGTQAIAQRAGRARELGRALAAVSPLATLARGFTIVRRPGDGAVVTHAAPLRAGDRLDVQWADGTRPVRVEPDREN